MKAGSGGAEGAQYWLPIDAVSMPQDTAGLGEHLLTDQSTRPVSPERGGLAGGDDDGALRVSRTWQEAQRDEEGGLPAGAATMLAGGDVPLASPLARRRQDTARTSALPRASSRTERPERDAAMQQLSDVRAVYVEGMPQPKFNAVYRFAGEHDGWCRFESNQGTHLFRFIPDGEWFVHDRAGWLGSAARATAHIRAEDGPLPVGEHQWLVWRYGKWSSVPLTLTLLRTDEEVHQHTERQKVKQAQLQAEQAWLCGDFALAALFVALGAALLFLALAPGYNVASSNKCNSRDPCIFTENYAVDGHRLDGLLPVSSNGTVGKQECCKECKDHPGCTVATYLYRLETTTAPATCLLYLDNTKESWFKMKVATIPFAHAAVCGLPADAARSGSATRDEVETALGASALLMRFGGFALLLILGRMKDLIGYGGASLGQTVLKPRHASVVAATLREQAQTRDEAKFVQVPEAASWVAIAAGAGPPSTWTAARRGLGLSVRQAVWSCGTKMLLWHWSQPLSYFAVFGAYYCMLKETTQIAGIIVAVREAFYLLSTLLALWLNPAYLLLELGFTLPTTEEAALAEWCCSRWWRSAKSVQSWVVYLLAPHHFVTLCLRRRVMHWRCGACGAALMTVAAIFQIFADLMSVVALGNIILDKNEASRPVGLVIGYWLTTAGFAAGGGGFGFAVVAATCSGLDPVSGENLGWGCTRRLLFGLVGLVFGLLAVLGGVFMMIFALALAFELF